MPLRLSPGETGGGRSLPAAYFSALGTSVLPFVNESKENKVTYESLVGLGSRNMRSSPDCYRRLKCP